MLLERHHAHTVIDRRRSCRLTHAYDDLSIVGYGEPFNAALAYRGHADHHPYIGRRSVTTLRTVDGV